MPSEKLQKLGKMLSEKGVCIATVESATAGRLAAELSMLEQSGSILKGGIVCYDAGIKTSLLGVPKSLLETFSPESAEVTEAITKALAARIDADIYIGVTGLTTPGGSETDEKPVGTMFFHISGVLGEFPLKKIFQGSPEEIVLSTIDAIAETLTGTAE